MEANPEMLLSNISRKISEILLLCKDHPHCKDRAIHLLTKVSAQFSADVQGEPEGETPNLKEVKKQVTQHLKVRRGHSGSKEPDKQILKSICHVIAKRKGLAFEEKGMTKDAMFEWIHSNWNLVKGPLFELIDGYGVPSADAKPLPQQPK